MTVVGHKEAGEQLSITFENFDKKANYRIDFGDGSTRALNNKKINHTYQKPGQYDLQLVINYQDQPVQRVSQKITI